MMDVFLLFVLIVRCEVGVVELRCGGWWEGMRGRWGWIVRVVYIFGCGEGIDRF